MCRVDDLAGGDEAGIQPVPDLWDELADGLVPLPELAARDHRMPAQLAALVGRSGEHFAQFLVDAFHDARHLREHVVLGRLLRRQVGHHHLGIGQAELDRLLDHAFVYQLHAVLAHQLREVLNRREVRRPVRFRQPAQISRRRVVPNLLLHLAVRQPPERHQRQRSQRGSQLWRPPRGVLQLLRADLLGPHLHLRPVHRVGQDHHRVVVGQRDLRLLGAGEQVGLTAAAASSWSFGHHGPPWSHLHEPYFDRPVDLDLRSDRNDPGFRRATAGRLVPTTAIVQRPPGTFDHHRLDAFHVAREALRAGDAIARRLPRGYAALSDQLRRALLAAYLGIAEASSRQGQDRLARFRCARGEASEAAAAIEAIQVLALAPTDQTRVVLDLCDRLCAMLTRLSGAATGSHPPSRGR